MLDGERALDPVERVQPGEGILAGVARCLAKNVVAQDRVLDRSWLWPTDGIKDMRQLGQHHRLGEVDTAWLEAKSERGHRLAGRGVGKACH